MLCQQTINPRLTTEAVVHKCFSKQVFLKIPQYSQKNTCVEAWNFIKKRLHYRCFPVNIVKFLKTAFVNGKDHQNYQKNRYFTYSKMVSYLILLILNRLQRRIQTLSDSKDEAFCENSYQLLAVKFFCKTIHLRSQTGF